MTEHLSIQKFNEITAALQVVETIEEIKGISDMAEAARIYSKQARLGLETQNRAAEIRVRALRREGEILKAMKERGELRGKGGSNEPICGARILTLPDLDIKPHESADSQAIASIPEDEFETEVAKVKADEKQISASHFAEKGRGKKPKPKRKKGPMKISAPEKDILETRSSDGVILALQAARETIADQAASWGAATRERVLSSFHELKVLVREVLDGRKT